jgi:TPR repeat protein
MNRTFMAVIAGLMLAVGLASAVAAGPLEDIEAAYEDASTAYKKGDYATALRLIRPLAEQGVAEAQDKLGLMYEYGQGVPKDYAAAMGWYRKAAEQGLAGAQYALGFIYENGQGVPQDGAAAASWYRKAAVRGFAKAQNNLGLRYWKGEGVPQDYVLAHMWFNLSAASGNKVGAKGRDLIATEMTPQQISEAQKLAREMEAEMTTSDITGVGRPAASSMGEAATGPAKLTASMRAATASLKVRFRPCRVCSK